MTKTQRKNHKQKVAARSATVQQMRAAFMLRYAALSVLPLTELRKRSRGVVKNGYSMRKDQLIESLVRSEITV